MGGPCGCHNLGCDFAYTSDCEWRTAEAEDPVALPLSEICNWDLLFAAADWLFADAPAPCAAYGFAVVWPKAKGVAYGFAVV